MREPLEKAELAARDIGRLLKKSMPEGFGFTLMRTKMIDEKELRDIIKRTEHHKILSSVESRDIATLVEVCESVLSAKMPEKKSHVIGCVQTSTSYCGCGAVEINQAIDSCRLAVARDYLHRDKLLTLDVLDLAGEASGEELGD